MVASRSITIGVGLAPVRGAPWTLLPNGDFSSPTTPPTLGSGVTISNGRANAVAAGQMLTWAGVLTIGHSYRITLDYSCSSGSKLRVNNSSVNGANTKTLQSVTADSVARSITFLIFVADNTDLSIEADSAVYSGWIDNVVATEFPSDAAILSNGDFTRVTPSNQTFGANATASPGALTCTAASSIVSWTTVLSVGQQYSVAVNYNCSSGANLRASNNATDGTNVVDIKSVTADSTNRTLTFATFTATTADFTIGADTATYSGTITSVVATLVPSSNVTLALTGQSLSLAQGSLLASTALALTGGSLTASQGSVAPQTSLALSGQTLVVAQGSVAPSTSVALTGQSLTVAQGTITAATSRALSGQALTIAQGSLAPSTTKALTGQALTIAQGSLAPSNLVALTGLSLTVAGGTITAGTAAALSGQSLTATQGSVGHSLSISLAGQSLVVALGNVTVASSDVTAALTGHGMGLSLGILIATVVNGSPQLQDIAVNAENLVNEPLPAASSLNLITEPSGQIVNHPPSPPAVLA